MRILRTLLLHALAMYGTMIMLLSACTSPGSNMPTTQPSNSPCMLSMGLAPTAAGNCQSPPANAQMSPNPQASMPATTTGTTCAAGAALAKIQGSPQEPAAGPVTSPIPVTTMPDQNGPPLASGSKIFMITVNNPLSAYGAPDVFWNKLNQSPMIHVLDQYVGSSANYPLCDTLEIDNVPTDNIQFNPLIQQAYNTFLSRGDGTFSTLTGTSALYDIFIPPTSTGPNAAGCSSHDFGYTNLGGQTNITFVYAEITLLPGCGTHGSSVNGHIVDTIASTLIHENFEAISDPLVNAWKMPNGDEIGDLCNMPWQNYVMNDQSQYFIQAIFSNSQQACAYGPP
jgi:hypothetical protein